MKSGLAFWPTATTRTPSGTLLALHGSTLQSPPRAGEPAAQPGSILMKVAERSRGQPDSLVQLCRRLERCERTKIS
jgi:hypothetical protein